jgi:hypothetical protein
MRPSSLSVTSSSSRGRLSRVATLSDGSLWVIRGERRQQRQHVMMAGIAVAQALTGRKVATPGLRFVDGAVFLGPPTVA